jgi:hypothetical protein
MISGPTPAATVRVLREALQQAISCVSDGVVTTETDSLEVKLMLSPRRIRCSDGFVLLSVRHSAAMAAHAGREQRSRWQAHTTGYMYSLDDADGHEVLSYHWHPQGRGHVMTPHLHLGAGAGGLRRELQKAHLTTGLVTSIAMLRLLIESFAVQPRRTDAAAVLERAETVLAGA